MREGGERVAPLYLVYADRDQAGPGVLRLAQIIHERTQAECRRMRQSQPATPRRQRKSTAARGA
jgi:hypothetical protein